MRSDIFIEWLHYLDNWFRTMSRKVVLLVDNAGSHFNPKILEDLSGDSNDNEEMNIAESSHSAQDKNKRKKKPDIKLTNIKLIYLPPNTTAHLQPMDAGIIHSFKSKYK